jgi:hypothetical protein
MYFGGALSISFDEILSALLWMFQSTMISTFLLIVLYIFKYSINKRIFNIKKWQDWKFILFASVVPLILIDLIRKLDLSIKIGFTDNFLANFLLTLIISFIAIIISSFILDKEKEPIVIDMKKIEEELMEGELK